MNIAGYRINLDALLARLIYRWSGRALAAAIVVSITVGLASGLIPPFWRERATFVILAAPGATVHVDDRGWPHTVYAGAHTVHATMPVGEATLPRLPLAPDLVGLWQGSELLLQSGEQAWLLALPEGDTQRWAASCSVLRSC